MSFIKNIKQKAKALKKETYALYYAAHDNRTPWYAKGLILFTIGYAMSPIDLIPDFIPVLGYLDDIIIIPACIALCLKMIPADVMVSARQKAEEKLVQKRSNWVAAGVIIFLWLSAFYLISRYSYAWYWEYRK